MKSQHFFTCYNCGKPGRIIHQPAKTTRFNTRRVNYLDNEYDTSEDEEAEVYLTTRARTYNKAASKFSKGQQLRKRVRTGDEMDEGEDEETYIPVSSHRRSTRPSEKKENSKL